MSGRLVSAVFESTLPAWLKPYAAACASFAADDGSRVYPSIKRIARMVGRCERATQTAVHELRRRGVLIMEVDHARYRATRYRFNREALPALTDAAQLDLFPQPRDLYSRGKPADPEFFHSHTQALTSSPLPVMGAVDCTRSVRDPSLRTYPLKTARARDKGKYQKTGTDE